MSGEAANISLSAIGAQEPGLLSNTPTESPFYPREPSQHSEFRKFHRVTNVKPRESTPGWPFGQRSIKVTFETQNMGDLLSNMWVHMELPALGNGENFADQVGRHIFKSVRIFADETELEVFHGDWGVIWDELYLETSEKVANRFLVNRSLAFDATQTNPSDANFKADLMIPLQFFFCRKYVTDEYSANEVRRPYLPLCAMYKQKLIIEFEVHQQQFFANTASTLALSSFDIVTEEITIRPEERLYLMRNKQTMVTDVVRRHPELDIESNSERVIKLDLVPNLPVKAIHWFFRDTRFENESVVGEPGETDEGELYVHNRFNFSRDMDFDELNTFFSPVMKSARFHINGNPFPNITNATHGFYKYLVPYQHRLSRPIRNIYTCAFSLDPGSVNPTGSLDFTMLKSDRTNIEITLESVATNSYTMHMYYTAYKTFMFEDGKLSDAISVGGTALE